MAPSSEGPGLSERLSDMELGESVRSMRGSMREVLTGNGEQEGDLLDSCCPRLSYRQRLMGWAACFVAGTLISLAAGHRWRYDPASFGRMYTLGNLVSLAGSFFLMGPAGQLRAMIDSKRRWTTVVLVVLFVSTISVG